LSRQKRGSKLAKERDEKACAKKGRGGRIKTRDVGSNRKRELWAKEIPDASKHSSRNTDEGGKRVKGRKESGKGEKGGGKKTSPG